MPRPNRNKLTPWIETLILSYGSEEGNANASVSGRLKAHVIAVGQMSLSQAQTSDGPNGLLFLSDGAVQIPAVLTSSAWEHLQEQEDRECFTSLINTTVSIRDYRLEFHAAAEQTKSRFYLSVGELSTTSTGPAKDNKPCCTTLASVRAAICKTWRRLSGQESQESQSGLDLSELLGEWRHDCVRSVLDDVRGRIATNSNQFAATIWDKDRVKYKADKSFDVPVKYLMIPQEVDRSVATDDDEYFPLIDCDVQLLTNPWDIFPPPFDSASSSDSSPEPAHTAAAAILTSTQLPTATTSYFTPYQKQQQLPATKRKRSEPSPETTTTSTTTTTPTADVNPPSWLFETQANPDAAAGDEAAAAAAAAVRKTSRQTPSMHGDGAPFAYAYDATRKNLQDLSRFKVSESLIHWAVKYLVKPKKNK